MNKWLRGFILYASMIGGLLGIFSLDSILTPMIGDWQTWLIMMGLGLGYMYVWMRSVRRWAPDFLEEEKPKEPIQSIKELAWGIGLYIAIGIMLVFWVVRGIEFYGGWLYWRNLITIGLACVWVPYSIVAIINTLREQVRLRKMRGIQLGQDTV